MKTKAKPESPFTGALIGVAIVGLTLALIFGGMFHDANNTINRMRMDEFRDSCSRQNLTDVLGVDGKWKCVKEAPDVRPVSFDGVRFYDGSTNTIDHVNITGNTIIDHTSMPAKSLCPVDSDLKIDKDGLYCEYPKLKMPTISKMK